MNGVETIIVTHTMKARWPHYASLVLGARR